MRKVTPEEEGCWIDGRFGDHNANLTLLRLAVSFGWSPGGDIQVEDAEEMYQIAEEAEYWLNEHVAPEGYLFFWSDGDFVLMPTYEWEAQWVGGGEK